MKLLYLYFILALHFTAQSESPESKSSANTSPVVVSVNDPNIHYVGRWNKTQLDLTQGNWNGHYFRTKFTGSSIAILVNQPVLLSVSLDGEPFRKVNARPEMPIQLNLEPLKKRVHSLQIGSAGQNYRVAFKGLVLDPGANTLPPVVRPIIEFIGDSITTGTDYNYAWLAAEMLGRDHTQIAFSGVALTDGYGCSSKTGMEVQYFRQHNYNSEKKLEEFSIPWDFSSYTPEMVVILLGQNDQCGKAPAESFIAAYKRLVIGIRGKFPKAPIVMLRTLGGPYEQQIRTAYHELRKVDPSVHYVDTTDWLNKEDYSDGIHPNATGNLKLARGLSNKLEPLLTATTLKESKP